MALVFKIMLFLLTTFLPLTVNSSFDFFKLVQQWPKGYCVIYPTNCKRIPIPGDFTIHGLWPANFTASLDQCTKTPYALLTSSELAKWVERNRAWPDLTKPTPDILSRFTSRAQSFWKYEWDHHGTCSESLYPQPQYFDAAVNLRKDGELLNILLHAGIHQNSNVEVASVNQTIAMPKKVPDLKCDLSRKPGVNLPALQEIGICFDPALNPIDCPIQSRRTNTCLGGTKDQLYFA